MKTKNLKSCAAIACVLSISLFSCAQSRNVISSTDNKATDSNVRVGDKNSDDSIGQVLQQRILSMDKKDLKPRVY